MKVLVTGYKGYVGSILCRILREQNYEIVGCDIGYFPNRFLRNYSNEMCVFSNDIRDITVEELRDINSIIHLAALSNDPLGEIKPTITNEINYSATVKLATLAKKAGVERFIFSSSCSIYGNSSKIVTEDSDQAPITAYARSKINAEKDLLLLKDENFIPVILRNATVYGASPSQRLDLVVNNLTASAFTTGKVKLLSDGTAWRPLLHVEDMANAFIECVKASKDKIIGEIFNVGSNEQNFIIKDIADVVQEIIPKSKIEYSKNSDKDERSYKVSFDKIRESLNYRTHWSLKDGIKQLYDLFKVKNFSEEDFKDKNFHRVKYLKWLLENKIIDDNLRFLNK